MSRKEDVEFLEAYLKELQKYRWQVSELCPSDITMSKDIPADQKAKMERAAQLANSCGIDGNIFLDLWSFGLGPIEWIRTAEKQLRKQIETIPKIIEALKKPDDRTAIPEGVEMIDVVQLAYLLGCKVGSVYKLNKKGHLPKAWNAGGKTSNLKWPYSEIKHWIKNGSPPLQEWEDIKKKNKTLI
jgi:predicted DNA-binding transcriptional regulator AlpA